METTNIPELDQRRQQQAFLAVAVNNGKSSVIGNFALASICFFLLYQETPSTVIIGWYGLFLLSLTLRILFYVRFKKCSGNNYGSGVGYLFFSVVTGLLWGAGCLFCFPESPSLQILFTVCVCGLCGAAPISLCTARKTMQLFLLLALLPLSLALLQLGGTASVALALFCILYLLFLLNTGDSLSRTMTDSIVLRLHNERLLEQQKATMSALRKASDEALAASEAKSNFLANMSHEIRTPMNGVLGTLQLLLDSSLTQEQKSLAVTAHKSGKSLLGILNEILDFSKIEAGKIELEKIPFHIDALISEQVQLLRGKAQEKGLKIECVFPESSPWLLGDPTRIRQILGNLITNAVKFSDSGPITVFLRFLRVTDKMAELQLEIVDNGIGISSENQKKLFQAFIQADNSTTRKYGGTGLGLAITKKMVELMEGSITVSSELGEGTRFRIDLTLPVCDPVEEEETEVVNLSREDFAGMHILLVEDNKVNRMVAGTILKKLGCRVSMAENGEIAIEKIFTESFDLVFMDCQMPVLDGYGATRRIRERERDGDSRIPIIAMTANAMKGDRDKCLNAGMDDYLSKPVRIPILKEKLWQWLCCSGPNTKKGSFEE